MKKVQIEVRQAINLSGRCGHIPDGVDLSIPVKTLQIGDIVACEIEEMEHDAKMASKGLEKRFYIKTEDGQNMWVSENSFVII